MSEHKDEIRWHCRRGMLELDVLLEHFYDHHYAQLSDHDKRLFVSLLDCEDQALYQWLLGANDEMPSSFNSLVTLIRSYNR